MRRWILILTILVSLVSFESCSSLSNQNKAINTSNENKTNVGKSNNISKTSAPNYIAPSEMVVSIGKGSGKPGDTVEIPVDMQNVPADGIVMTLLDVGYDKTKFSFKELKAGSIVNNREDFELNANEKVSTGMRIMYFNNKNAGHPKVSKNGTFCTLSFQIGKDCPKGEYTVCIRGTDKNAAVAGTGFVTGAADEGKNGNISATLKDGKITVE